MVRVCFPDPSDNSLRFIVEGHSGHSEKGSDPVCAGVSSLVLTFLGGLEKELHAKITGHISGGECNVNVLVENRESKHLKLISDVFRYGFERLACEYPGFLSLEK
ncbi:MAG: ribosomal-processing cysteine protease Prp [Candidatus Riflebacteria bacterium]|nr:ribosomal-processing cysteine protease Prp [Candidatus Riflebacteria bacterium]